MRRWAIALLPLALLAPGAAAQVDPGWSLVICKDGTRHLGAVEEDLGRVTCDGATGKLQLPLRDVAEIVGPASKLVKTTPEERFEHRTPDLARMISRHLREKLAGDPPGLERVRTDDRWEIWLAPGEDQRKLGNELRQHLRGIINRMQAFFPRADKPEIPCRVRVFDDSESFLAWRDRAAELDRPQITRDVLSEYYTGPTSVLLADVRAHRRTLTVSPDEVAEAARKLIQASQKPEDLIKAIVILSFASVAFAMEEETTIEAAMNALIHGDDDAAGALAGQPTPPRIPTGDPSEEGEETFINYGYYSSTTEELVVWKSDMLWTTLSHETFHYFLYHNCPDAPIWVNEGFATYFETFGPHHRQKYQGFNFGRYEELMSAPRRGVPMVPLEQLMVLPIQVWQAQQGPVQSFLYCESWVFIHYLLHGEEYSRMKKGEKLLKKYLTSLAEGATPEEAMKEHFSGRDDLERINEELLYYIQRLKRPDEQ